jgi:hypothetical protein
MPEYPQLTEADRFIEMAREGLTPFSAMKAQLGLSEANVAL